MTRDAGADPGERVLDALLRLVDDLHAEGVGTAVGEVVDAADAVTHVGLADRAVLRAALASVLVKRAEHLPAYHRSFDRHFPRTAADALPPPGVVADGGEHDLATHGSVATTHTPADAATGRTHDGDDGLLAALHDALLDERRDDEWLRDAARVLVARHAGIGDTHGSERYHLQRVLRALDLARVIGDAMRAARHQHGDDAFALRLRRDEMLARTDALKRLIAEEVRRRLFAGVGTTGTGLVAPRRIEDTPIVGASARELQELRAAVRPLARKLAHRLAQKHRRGGRAALDMRRTIRASLQSGGVPVDLRRRRRARPRPDVVVLCDISGSVAEFAHFTMLLLQALQHELRQLRSFVFVDGCAEVTTLLAGARADLDPRLLVTLPGVVVDDGHSDYAAALRRFLERHEELVRSTTAVIITGDGRSNHRPPAVAPLRVLRDRARAVYWFDPEPREQWDSHDAAMAAYRPLCTAVHEVRTLAQLSRAIEAIL